jgi:hypothetical protein
MHDDFLFTPIGMNISFWKGKKPAHHIFSRLDELSSHSEANSQLNGILSHSLFSEYLLMKRVERKKRALANTYFIDFVS